MIENGRKDDYLESEEIYYAFDADDNFSFEILYVKQSTIQEPGLHISFYDNRNRTLDFKQGILAGKWNICDIYIVPEKHICQVKVHMCRAGLFSVYGSNTYASAESGFIPISDVNSNLPLSYNSIDGKVSDAELKELYNQMVEVTLIRFDEWLQNNDIGCQIQDFKIVI